MKGKVKTVLKVSSLSLICLGIAGIGIGVTYAGYAKEAPVAQQIGAQRYIFLNAQNWEPNDTHPDYYLYVFSMKTSPSDSAQHEADYQNPQAKQWYKGTKVSGSGTPGVYWFYVPTRYEWGVFVRARDGAPLADIQAWKTSSDEQGREAVWNQTVNISLNVSYNIFTPDGIDNGARSCSPSIYSLPTPE